MSKLYKDSWATSILVITVFELLDASVSHCWYGLRVCSRPGCWRKGHHRTELKTDFSPASGGSKEKRESERKAATESAYSAPRQYNDPGSLTFVFCEVTEVICYIELINSSAAMIFVYKTQILAHDS